MAAVKNITDDRGQLKGSVRCCGGDEGSRWWRGGRDVGGRREGLGLNS